VRPISDRTFNARFSTARRYFDTSQWAESAARAALWRGSSEFPAALKKRFDYVAGSRSRLTISICSSSPTTRCILYRSRSNVAYTPPLATLEANASRRRTFNAAPGARHLLDGKLGRNTAAPHRENERVLDRREQVFTGVSSTGHQRRGAMEHALGADTVAQIYASRLNAPYSFVST